MAYKVGPLPNRNRRKGSIGGVLLCAPIKGRTRLSYMPQFIANRIRVPNRIGIGQSHRRTCELRLRLEVRTRWRYEL